jgi:hypothetical protein
MTTKGAGHDAVGFFFFQQLIDPPLSFLMEQCFIHILCFLLGAAWDGGFRDLRNKMGMVVRTGLFRQVDDV